MDFVETARGLQRDPIKVSKKRYARAKACIQKSRRACDIFEIIIHGNRAMILNSELF